MNLGCLINSSAVDGGPACFEDPVTGIITLYFASERPGLGEIDIYASTLRSDGVFGRPALVWELSSPRIDQRPAIRLDGLEMFIRSNRDGGLGDDDIWVSTRETTRDAWSAPVNLGRPINTEYNDGAATLSPDGTTLYFNSTPPGGCGDSQDLYTATRKRVD
jgi:hypothetical protein